jgi:arachidonate 15-lipoxygenase
MISPKLPQNDTETENAKKRREYLEQNREIYKFDLEYLKPLPLLDSDPNNLNDQINQNKFKNPKVDIIPDRENFSGSYNGEKFASTVLPLGENLLLANARSLFDKFDNIDDYIDNVFTVLPKPSIIKHYQTDIAFANQRLAGANPVVIRKLEPNSPEAEVIRDLALEDQYSPINLLERLDNGHIYITDYTGNDPNYPSPGSIANGTYNSRVRKYLPKPRAFFCWRDIGISDRGELIPIAIQLEADIDSPVYTPSEKNSLDWFFAKLCVQVADANHHEMSTHLCRTHFVMEPFAISTARQLAKNHPLSILLTPHFRFMLALNHQGRHGLINENGPVDKLLAGSLAESLQIVTDSYENWDFQKSSFLNDLKSRGVKDANHLPHYPFRDDGILLWEEITEFVTKYLKYFYKDSTDITKDTELQGWAQELSTTVNIKGMPSVIQSVDNQSVDNLISIVSNIIFTCGPLHSAINYAQYEYMTFAPNQPFAAYSDPQSNEKEKPISMETILKFLPPYKQTMDQLQIVYFLSAYRYDKLGDYDRTYRELYQQSTEQIFEGTPVINIIKEFQQNLTVIGDEINRRNQSRLIKYPYFHPSLITNSISV